MKAIVNTLYFLKIRDGLYTQFKTNIPPELIPEAYKEVLERQYKELKEIKAKDLSKDEKQKEINKFNQEKQKIFALFLNLEDNLTLLNFNLGKEKEDFFNDENQINVINSLLEKISNYVGTQKAIAFPFNKSLEVLDDKVKEISFLKALLSKLTRLMIINQIRFSDYQDKENNNKNYDKYIKLNEKELSFFQKLDDDLETDDFLKYAIEIKKTLNK